MFNKELMFKEIEENANLMNERLGKTAAGARLARMVARQ